MKKQILLLGILLSFAFMNASYAQEVTFDWVKTFGGSNANVAIQLNGGNESNRHIKVDDSGNVYGSIIFSSGNDLRIGSRDYYVDSGRFIITKSDYSGSLIWSRQL